MRTTLTLDDDVAAQLRELQKQRGWSLRELVNRALRAGLDRLQPPRKRRKRYRLQPVSLGRCKLEVLDDIAGVLAVIEGEDHR